MGTTIFIGMCGHEKRKQGPNSVARTQKQDEKLIMNEVIVCGPFLFPREFNADSPESYNDASRARIDHASLNISQSYQ